MAVEQGMAVLNNKSFLISSQVGNHGIQEET